MKPTILPWLSAAAAVAAESIAPQPTTVSVYLPEYGEADWAALRGSIISSVSARLIINGRAQPGKRQHPY